MAAIEEPATLLRADIEISRYYEKKHTSWTYVPVYQSSLSASAVALINFFPRLRRWKSDSELYRSQLSTWKLELSSSYSLTHIRIYYFVVYPRPVGIRIFFGRYHVRGDVRGRKWLDPRRYLTSSRPNRRHKSQRDKTSRMEPLASSSHRKRELSRHFP